MRIHFSTPISFSHLFIFLILIKGGGKLNMLFGQYIDLEITFFLKLFNKIHGF